MIFFLYVTIISKLKRLYLVASRTITGYLSSFPIPLLFSEASLAFLGIDLTRFVLSSDERALRLSSSSFKIGLARLNVKPKLFWSSWRDCIHLTVHAFSFIQRGSSCVLSLSLLVPALQFEAHFLYYTLLSDLLISREGAALANLDFSISRFRNLGRWLRLFSLVKEALVPLKTAHSVALKPLFHIG